MERVRVDEVEASLRRAGMVPGTPTYQVHERMLKVQRCQRLRGLISCDACEAAGLCEIRAAHLRDAAAGLIRQA